MSGHAVAGGDSAGPEPPPALIAPPLSTPPVIDLFSRSRTRTPRATAVRA